MKITKEGVWLKDERGNRSSVEYFGSEEAARTALESLEDCDDCTNCSGCSRCSYCSDCSRCSHVAGLASKKGGSRDQDMAPTNLGAPPIPAIENIHQKVFEAASQPEALAMGSWHICDTTHCRAGWVTHLAGDAGRALEDFHNTELAAMLIYRESSPIKVEPWKFYQTERDALADMKRCADEEAGAA